jgi:hypothetical protein
MALAHAIENKVEAAYRRGDLFAKRQLLIAEWAKFCARIKRAGDGQVVPIGRRGSKGGFCQRLGSLPVARVCNR